VGASSTDIRLETTVDPGGPLRAFRQAAIVPTAVTIE
jgi:hypothetical protein